jgi:hypothetical protein
MLWSTREVPVLVYADTTWKSENLSGVLVDTLLVGIVELLTKEEELA